MKSYQDLMALGDNEGARMDFVRDIVREHMSTKEYKLAKDAEEYYAKRNVTIRKYEKLVMDTMGRAVADKWSSNYKLTHGFFRRFAIQQMSFILANGVTFKNDVVRDKVGADKFDIALMELCISAYVDGVSFGFWNYDHLEVFRFADTGTKPGFAPIYDEDTGLLRAGVRYWSPSANSQRWTLYEEDGYTEYARAKDHEMYVLKEKRTYIQNIKSTDAMGVQEIVGLNYPSFPIIPLYINDERVSELEGIRSSIDCYDFISSGMANNIDDTSAFYWAIKGAGGMDDVDLVEFVHKMRKLHATVLPDGAEATANTISIPVEANEAMLERLKNDMYEDAMLINPAKLQNQNVTATALSMAYLPQEDNSQIIENRIRQFIYRLFELLGVDDEISFKWNKVSNVAETTQSVLMAAQFMDEQSILELLPFLTPEKVTEILDRKAAEGINRLITGEDVIDNE